MSLPILKTSEKPRMEPTGNKHLAGAASLGPAATPAERPFVPDNPAAALKQWLDNSETVQTLLGIAKDYEALFSAFPVVGFFYGLYTSYQKDRADKERAKEIIRQVVEQIRV